MVNKIYKAYFKSKKINVNYEKTTFILYSTYFKHGSYWLQ